MKGHSGIKPRLETLLREAGEGGLPIGSIYEAFPDEKRSAVSNSLQWLKNRGQAQTLGNRHWAIAQPPVLVATDGLGGLGTIIAGQIGTIAEEAAALIGKSDAGADSGALADALRCTVETVEQALQPAVDDHKLVTCNIFRGGRALTAYRISAGGTQGYDWRRQAEATWLNKPNVQMPPKAAPRSPSRPVEAPRPPAPAPVAAAMPATPVAAPAPAPAPTPAAAPAPEPQLRAEVAEELVPPPPPRPEPPSHPLRYVGELDIDAADRAHAATKGHEISDFLAALYSNGALMIETRGQRVTMPVEHTRKLFRYLDALRGDEIVEAAVGEVRS